MPRGWNLLKHGMTGTPTYGSWRAMRDRCNLVTATNYPHYGGRGIKVCERWDNFENFLADMGERPPGHTLDRYDNDLGYEPSNCRWRLHEKQSANRRPWKHKGLSRMKRRFTDTQVRAIRADQRTHISIAEDYCVCRELISQIKRGKIYRYVHA